MFRTGFVGRQFPSGLGAGTITGAAPSLNLDFTSGVLDSRITFTRASTATYFDSTGTMQTAGNNVARFDYDPVLLQMRGLLIEESRQNYTIFSQAINSWSSKLDSTVTDNSIASPDGTIDASLVTEGSAGTAQVQSTTPAVSGSGLTLTYSIYIKRGNTDWIEIIPSDSGAVNGATTWFNTATGLIGTAGLRGTSTNLITSVQRLPNGWYRVVYTVTMPATSSTAGWTIRTATGDGSVTRVSGGTYYMWGAQAEVGAFPTSYIPTTASAVTRAAESATMPIGSWYNPAAGTFGVEYILPQIPASGTQGGVLRVDDGTSNNDGLIFVSAASQTFVFGVSGGVTQLNNNTGAPVLNTISKSAFTYGGLWTGQTNAGPVSIGTGSTPMISPTRVALGTSHASLTQWQLDGWMRRVKYWPRALAGGEMQGENMVPSLDIDLRAPTLDPRITFTRASSGSFFNSAGVLTTVGNNVPRLDYDPVTLQPRGLLIEEARTNSIRNSVAAGAVPGINLAGGSLPINWGVALQPTGTTLTILGSGTENGLGYVDVRLAGTPTATGFFSLSVEGNTQIAASQGQAWAGSVYVKLIGGSLAGLSTGQMVLIERNAGGTNIGSSSPNPYTPATTPLAGNRWLISYTTVQATIAFISLRIDLANVPQLVPIDVSLRIGAPQVELGAFATSYIPTSGAAATRTVENASILTGPWYNASANSVVAEGLWPNLPAGAIPRFAELSDGTTNNFMSLTCVVNSNAFQNAMTIGGVAQTTAQLITTAIAGTPIKVGGVNTASAHNLSVSGSAPVSQTNTSAPTVTTLGIGNRADGTRAMDGYIRRVRVWPRALADADLQAATR